MDRQLKIIPRNKKSILQNINSVFSLSEFKTKVSAFRKKYNIRKPGKAACDRLLKMRHPVLDDAFVWTFDLFSLIQEMGLDQQWFPVVFEYVAMNTVSTEKDSEGVVAIKETIDCPKFTKDEYYLQIHKGTTIKDINEAWPKIKKFLKLNDSKSKEIKNFDRNSLIYELRKDKKLPYKEIKEILKNNGYGNLDEPYIRTLCIKEGKRIAQLRTVYLKK